MRMRLAVYEVAWFLREICRIRNSRIQKPKFVQELTNAYFFNSRGESNISTEILDLRNIERVSFHVRVRA
jgi:hypothetical protein